MDHSTKPSLHIAVVTKERSNDLLRTLNTLYAGIYRYETLADALAAHVDLRAVMLLADGYPEAKTAAREEDIDRLRARGLRLYIEYPEKNKSLGTDGYDGEAKMGYSRAIVTDVDKIKLEMHSILYAHGAQYLECSDVGRAWLVAARVAGYDVATFGLSDCEMHALLFEGADGSTLIATTKLSQFISARYAPYARWCAVFEGILSFLVGSPVGGFAYTPAVMPSFSAKEPLFADAYRAAVRKNCEWYLRSGVLKSPDGREGIYEGFSSGDKFDAFGRQALRDLQRADCNGESVGALALASRLLSEPRYGEIAYNATHWLLCRSLLSQGERADKNDPQYGLLSWHDRAYDQYYGDDNAKAIIGLILAASALGTDEFDRRILEAIMANFRTTGAKGFRGARVMAKDLKMRGWRFYYEAAPVHYSAHFEALPWACYLWAYDKTGYRPLLERTERAIGMMMTAYENTLSPDVSDKTVQWRWTNGLQQERAKMILPLAWLVRLMPTDRHIAWLERMVRDLLKHHDAETGALADAFGKPEEGNGLYGPFTANSQYGKHESPVIQENGDPCSDSLYTASFAMVTLIEAQAAMQAAGRTEDAERFRTYARSLADYHVRIQQRSADPVYDGAWFRGFDFRKWETYGSDGDAGWGVFCIETGWSQAWISAALSLWEMDTNVWDLTKNTAIGRHIGAVALEMLEEEEV